MTIDYDIAIIGAGPSGCACALALHGKGIKVALFDKDVFPRDKVCGDTIPGPSFKGIDSVNVNWGNQLKALIDKMDVTTTTVYASATKSISYQWFLYSYNSKRVHFDNFLFQLVKNETDTTIFENKKLQKITPELNYSQLTFQDGSSVNVSMIVGCDGAHSIVKRQLIHKDGPDHNSIAAVRAYYKGIEGIKIGENECHFIKGVHGYFWIFPLQDNWANVGFGLLKKEKKNTPVNLRQTLDTITNAPAFTDRFKNATLMGDIKGFKLPIWTRKKALSGHRFLLCGDAASLVDPIFGHGIDKAIWSGIIAAGQVSLCFEEDNFSSGFMKQYDIRLHDKFGRELSIKHFAMLILLKFPFLIQFIVNLNFYQPLTNWIIRKIKI